MSHCTQAVVGIVFTSDRSQVLLIQRRDIPVWVLPGGGIETEESPEEAVCRELLEETGYTVKVKRKVAEYQPVNSMTQYTHFFECTIASGKPTTGPETKNVTFFPLTALPKLLPPPYGGWIADAQANQKEVIVKKIEGVSYAVLLKLLVCHPILVFRYLLTKVGIHLND